MLFNILSNYSSIVGAMIGGEVQTGETGEVVLSKLAFFKVSEVVVNVSQSSKWHWVDVEDGALSINGGTDVTIPISDTSRRTKFLMLSILPFHEGNVHVTVSFGDESIFETNFSYLENRLETNQQYLIVLNNSQYLEKLTIKTESPAVLFGFYLGID